nr:MAG TPA: hypothetical protein [Caudoviricetes sp.]
MSCQQDKTLFTSATSSWWPPHRVLRHQYH